MRTLPLWLLGGCAWFGEARDAAMADFDKDGFPRLWDCNDRDKAIQSLPPPLEALEPGVPQPPPLALTCGTRVQVELCEEQPAEPGPPAGCGDLALTDAQDDLDVLPCAHPAAPGQLLQVSAIERVHRLDVDAPSRVRVHMELLGALPARRLTALATPAHAILVVNRGDHCAPDSCVIGLPLAVSDEQRVRDRVVEGDEVAPPRTALATFVAEPGEPWFVIASGAGGDYVLQVECEPVGEE